MKIKPQLLSFFLIGNSNKESTVKMGNDQPEWTVIYHAPGKFKGRGEFLRLMLEDAGITDYVNSDKECYGPKGVMDMFRGSPEAINADLDSNDDYVWPNLYPPSIHHQPPNGSNKEDQVFVNQVGACMIYLGDKLGYAPETHAEKARANSILMNAIDYIADGRASFHPVKNTMSYNDQKEEGDRVSKEFTQDRMKKYLSHFNKIVHRAGSQKPVAGGAHLTYADFALFHVLDATIAQFNTDYYDHVWDNLDVPDLKAFHQWMASRPNLAAYFQSDRCFREFV